MTSINYNEETHEIPVMWRKKNSPDVQFHSTIHSHKAFSQLLSLDQNETIQNLVVAVPTTAPLHITHHPVVLAVPQSIINVARQQRTRK